jgi:hypothetical protein
MTLEAVLEQAQAMLQRRSRVIDRPAVHVKPQGTQHRARPYSSRLAASAEEPVGIVQQRRVSGASGMCQRTTIVLPSSAQARTIRAIWGSGFYAL